MSTVSPRPSGSHAPPEPARPRGPHAPTVATSLVGILVAVVLALRAAGLVHLDPLRTAPWALLVVGLLLVAAGLAGRFLGRG